MEAETVNYNLSQLAAMQQAKIAAIFPPVSPQYNHWPAINTAPNHTHIHSPLGSPVSDTEQMYLFQITVVDSRVEDDKEAINILDVRSLSIEGARLKALMELGYAERDLRFLDIFALKQSPVKTFEFEDDVDDE